MLRPLVISLLLTGCATLSGSIGASKAPFTVKVEGAGTPVIFIPGLSSPGEVWDGVVAKERANHECHVLSLAGFAGTPAINGPLLPQVKDALVAYITEHHLENASIVGHSLGGFLGMWLATEHPELVGKLVIVDSAPSLAALQNPDATAMEATMAASDFRDAIRQADAASRARSSRMVAHIMATSPESQEKIVRWSQLSDIDTVAEAAYFVMTHDLREDLSRLKAPTLVIATWRGSQAMLGRRELLARFTAQYSKCTTCTVTLNDTAKHFVMLDDEAGLVQQLDGFLATTTAVR